MFAQQQVDAGEVHVGEKKTIKFPYTRDDVYYIDSIQGCGCSSVTLDAVNKCVVMEYLPSGVPHHLQKQGYYTPTKAYNIGFTFKDGTSTKYTLSFTVKVLR